MGWLCQIPRHGRGLATSPSANIFKQELHTHKYVLIAASVDMVPLLLATCNLCHLSVEFGVHYHRSHTVLIYKVYHIQFSMSQY